MMPNMDEAERRREKMIDQVATACLWIIVVALGTITISAAVAISLWLVGA